MTLEKPVDISAYGLFTREEAADKAAKNYRLQKQADACKKRREMFNQKQTGAS